MERCSQFRTSRDEDMSFLDGFLGSNIFWIFVYMFIAWYILKIVAVEILGQPIGMFLMANRRVDFDDIDATAHLRLFREQTRAAKFSKGSGPRNLFIKSVNPNYYSTDYGGMHRIGKIKGMATYPSAHVITFRKAWGFRKFIFVAPPDMCISGTGSRNVIYEGSSVEVLNQDWVFPVPTAATKYTEQWMREWAISQYKIRMKQMSDANLVDFGEYLLMKAGSDTVEARMAQQQIADFMSRTESGEAEPDTGAID